AASSNDPGGTWPINSDRIRYAACGERVVGMGASPSVTFGDLLRKYRRAAGLTQEELASRAQVSPRAISDLERGQRNRPWRDTVQLLASALKLDASERARLEAASRQATERTDGQDAHPASHPWEKAAVVDPPL